MASGLFHRRSGSIHSGRARRVHAYFWLGCYFKINCFQPGSNRGTTTKGMNMKGLFRKIAEQLLLLAIIFLCVASISAHAQITWQSSYENGNLHKWSQVHCGGQGTPGPAAPPTNPAGAANFTEGSCSASTTGQFPQPSDGSGRYQLTSTPPGNRTDTVLKINLQHNDLWLVDWSPNSAYAVGEKAATPPYLLERGTRLS